MNIMHNTVLKQINDHACEMIDKPMPTLSEWAFDEFYRNGNRINYEKIYFERRKMLAVYGLKAIFEGDKVEAETLDKLNYVLFEILSEDTWALPAHVRKYEDPDWERTVDLFACETASAVGLIYRYAGKFLPEFLKDCMVREAYKRVLCPFFKENRSFGWEGCNHNWNAVCTGGIGLALLTLGEKAGFTLEEQEEGLERIKKSLRRYLNTAFSSDGVSLEGVGYFNYGMSFYLAFATELAEKGDRSLLDGDREIKDRLKQLGEFIGSVYLKNGYCVNFSDAQISDKILPGIAYGYNCAGIDLELPEEAYADFDCDPCYRFAGLYMSLRARRTVPVAQRRTVPVARYFPEAQWAILQSENGAAFAIKGGHNAEPHNHNDVGSFIYYMGDRCLACDLGQGEYTADYFGIGRYNYLCCGSKGHSLPVVADCYQEAGAEHRAASFEFVEKEDRVEITIEFHQAYPEGCCGFLQRVAEFNLKNGELTIKDYCDKEFLSAVVTQESPEIAVFYGEKSESIPEIFKNHQGLEEKVSLNYIRAKETENEISADRDSSRRIFCASFSISAGLL